MKIEQLYTQCLAEAAYYIESNGEAAIIDPLREVQPYLDLAEKNNTKIKYVFETHFHADFVSGHIDLSKKTGAQIVFGPTAQPNFVALLAKDDEEFSIGNVKIKVLHTPGHTMESSTFLLIDEEGKDHAIFTGDTLFLGDVGRPDLAVKTDLTREDLAAHLFDSLRNKIMPLVDDVIVYPGHGQGSACGKNMSAETIDTLGNQKLFNYALRPEMTKEEFVHEVTKDLVAPPQYFPKNAVMNKMGYDSIDEVLGRGVLGLDASEFKQTVEKNQALIIDTRHQNDFAKAHIPGSWFIGIDDNFAPWVGALVNDLETPIVFIAEEGKEEEVVIRLSRVGYDYALGFLKGGIDAWIAARATESINEVDAEFLKLNFNAKLDILDARKSSEFESQHVDGAVNFPLDFINDSLKEIDKDKPWYIHCAGGYRSMIMCSILKANGFNRITNMKGGFKAIKESSIPLSTYKEQVTML